MLACVAYTAIEPGPNFDNLWFELLLKLYGDQCQNP